LGDAGSLFIGYVFATVSIIGASNRPSPSASSSRWSCWRCGARHARRSSGRVGGKRITEADRGAFHHQLIFRFGLNVRQGFADLRVCFALGAVALALSGEFTHVFRTTVRKDTE